MAEKYGSIVTQRNVTLPDGTKQRRVQLFCEPGLTKQAFMPECDINNIIKKFEKTGMVNHLNEKQPFYGDVSNIASYADAINIVQEAEDLFMKMSPGIREKFNNDPEKMIAFLNDPKNIDEAIKLGMASKRPEMASTEPNAPVPDK